MEYAVRIFLLPVKLKRSRIASVWISERVEMGYVAIERIRRIRNVGQRDFYSVSSEEEKAADYIPN